MSGSGINVVLDEIKAHKADVDELADGLDEASDAAKSGQALGDSAFGIVGQIIAVAVQGWATQATTAVSQAGAAAHNIAEGLDETQSCYADNEQTNAQGFTDIQEGALA